MSDNAIDIKVKQEGAKEAAADILTVGDAARSSADSLDNLSKGLEGLKNLLGTIGIAFGIKEAYALGLAFHEIHDSIEDARKSLMDFGKDSVTILRAGIAQKLTGVTQTPVPLTQEIVPPGGTPQAPLTKADSTFASEMGDAVKELGIEIDKIKPKIPELAAEWASFQAVYKTTMVAGTTGTKALGIAIAGVGSAIETRVTPEVAKLNEAFDSVKDTFDSALKGGTTGLSELGTTAQQTAATVTESFGRVIDVTNQWNKKQMETLDLEGKIYDASQKTSTRFSDNAKVVKALADQTKAYGMDLDTLLLIASKIGEDKKDPFIKWLGSIHEGNINGRQLRQLMGQFPEIATMVASGMQKAADGTGQFAAGGKNAAQVLAEMTVNVPQVSGHLQKHAGVLGTAGATYKRVSMTVMDFVDAIKASGTELDVVDSTVEHGLVKVQNAIDRYLGKSYEAINNNQILAKGLEFLAANFETVVRAVNILGIALATIGAVQALSFAKSFLTLNAAIGLSVIALAIFADQIKVTADGTISLQDVFVGASNVIAQGAQQIITYFLTMNSTFNISNETANILRLTFLALAAVVIVALVPAIGTLLLAIGGVVAGFLAMGAIVALVRGRFEEFKTSVVDTATLIYDKLVTAIDAASKATDTNSKKLDKSKDDMDVMKQSVGSLGDALYNLDNANRDAAGGLGHLSTANKGAEDSTKKLTHTIASSAAENTKWYDTWTTQAEHDLDQLIAKQDEEAMKRRTAATPDGQIGGGFRTPLGDLEARAALLSAQQAVKDARQEMIDAGTDAAKLAKAQLDQVKAQIELSKAQANAPIGRIPDIQKVGPATITTRPGGYGAPGGGVYGSGGTQLGFASGGIGIVTGAGGTDSTLVKFLATPGERVGVFTPNQWSKMLGQIENPWWMGSASGGEPGSTAPSASANPFATSTSRSGGAPWGGNARPPIYLTMNVATPDVGSFRRNEPQIMTGLSGKLRSAQRNLGG